MDEIAQAPERFLARQLHRQLQKRHLVAVWAGLVGLRAGMCVLDIGSGPGILAAEYAAMVDPGVVFALEPRFALHVSRPNLFLLPQAADQEIVLPAVPDVVFLTDTLHHAGDPAGILARLRAVCGTKTRVLVTEYDPDGPGLVGAPKQRRMGSDAVWRLLLAAGFAVEQKIATADEHYAVIAMPA